MNKHQLNFGDTLGYVVQTTENTIVLVDKNGITLPKSIIEKLWLPEISDEEYLKAAKEGLAEDGRQPRL